MNEQRSIATLLTDLEARIETLRREVAFHEQQETHHRERGASSAATLAELETRLAEFRTAAQALLAVAPPPAKATLPASLDTEDWGTQARPKIGKMVERVIAEREGDAPFNPTQVSRDVNRRFAGRLKRSSDSRQISVILRRLAAAGKLEIARKGKAYEEALYTVA